MAIVRNACFSSFQWHILIMKLAAVYDIVGVRMGVLRLLLLLLTHALELVLELRLVVAVGNVEVEIRVILL